MPAIWTIPAIDIGATAQECRSATLSMANYDERTLHGGFLHRSDVGEVPQSVMYAVAGRTTAAVPG